MTESLAKLIHDAADEVGVDLSLRPDYSGRGMYGKATTGLIYSDQSDLLAAVMQAGWSYGGSAPNDADENREIDDIVHECKMFRFDSLGTSRIVY